MKKMEKGYHVYININNLESILSREERETDELRKAFHQLDTYVATIENYIARKGAKGVVEKLTASRLHLYFICEEDDISMQNEVFKTIAFGYHMAEYVSKKIAKYNNVLNYEIGVGVDYGDFTIFTFKEKDTKIEEITSIGYPANRAAKIQSITKSGKVAISNNVHDMLAPDLHRVFFENELEYQRATLRYAEMTVSDCKLEKLEDFFADEDYDGDEEFARNRANVIDIKEVKFSDSRKKIDYSELTLRNNRQISGIMLFADIRGFTKKFDPDGENLPKMKKATEKILKALYQCVRDEDGVHVQFQGDRISAFFHEHNSDEGDYIIRAYKCALALIDTVSDLNQSQEIKDALGDQKLCIGIGCSSGDIYATRLGMKNQKDNVAMGQTVREADFAEDNVAGVNKRGITTEIAVTKHCYRLLNQTKSELSKTIKNFFEEREGYYICNRGLAEVIDDRENEREKHNYESATRTTRVKPWKRNCDF
jgi:class 3 adenylate cyclase